MGSDVPPRKIVSVFARSSLVQMKLLKLNCKFNNLWKEMNIIFVLIGDKEKTLYIYIYTFFGANGEVIQNLWLSLKVACE